jgi:hypothetical protein
MSKLGFGPVQLANSLLEHLYLNADGVRNS